MRFKLPLRRGSEGEGGAYRVSDGRVRWCAPLVALFLLITPALAVEPSEMLSDPALEMRAREISRELRCVVCQNESVDDSPAEVARDIRRAVRERLVAGDTDRQVLDYMVARYGDYVLLQPPFKTRTLILWLGTPLVLLLGAAGLWFAARRRAAMLGPEPLSEDEKERVDRILRDAALRTAPQDEANGATTPPHPEEEANGVTTPPHPEERPQGASRRVSDG